jgi:2-methylcitrate dehydratase PrpD
VLDLLGVTLAGASSGHGEMDGLIAAFAGPGGASSIIGTGRRASPRDAAMVNGYAAHLLEFDHATLDPIGHPGVTILPSILALAEARGTTGREVLNAYLVGQEVHARLGQAQTEKWSYRDSWLPLGHIGVVSAAAAAARLLALTPRQTAHCLGLACHHAGQLVVSNGTLAKPLGAGQAARLAVEAALLAELGITAASNVIERPNGFAETFLGSNSEALADALSRLGGPSHLEQTGVAIKRYPSCYGTHWSVDALRIILEEQHVVISDIDTVELVYPRDVAFLDDPHPADIEASRFSMQFCLAACLIDGHPRLESFEDRRTRDPRFLAALERIVARPHHASVGSPLCWRHLVTVTTRHGERYECAVKRPRGHPRNPITADEVIEKFVVNAASLEPDRRNQVVDVVMNLEAWDDISMLTGHIHSLPT